MNDFLLNNYYKITDVINSCETPDHIECANNMLINLRDWIEQERQYRCKNIFSWEIWKWWYNYKEYNRFVSASKLVDNDITQLIQEWVKQYNSAVEEAQQEHELKLQEDMFKVTVVKGFQPNVPKKKKRRGKKNTDIVDC